MRSGCASCARLAARALLLAALALAQAHEAGAVIRGSALALPRFGSRARAGGALAQRAIERDWGPSDDSTYVEVAVPQWRSEGLAAGLSAGLPGLGQAYAGERRSGLFFGLLEIAGWTANRIYVHRAQADRDRAARYAGNPADSASAWSFERWADATGGDAAQVREIWARDPQAFYQKILDDPAFAAGWSGGAARTTFGDLRGRMSGNYRRATDLGYALWMNHVISALDALRAARLHNLPLRRDLELKLRSSWDRKGPELAAVLVRRF